MSILLITATYLLSWKKVNIFMERKTRIWLGYHIDDCPLNRKFKGFFFNSRREKVPFEATSFKDIEDNFKLMGFEVVVEAIPGSERILVEASEAGLQVSFK